MRVILPYHQSSLGMNPNDFVNFFGSVFFWFVIRIAVKVHWIILISCLYRIVDRNMYYGSELFTGFSECWKKLKRVNYPVFKHCHDIHFCSSKLYIEHLFISACCRSRIWFNEDCYEELHGEC